MPQELRVELGIENEQNNRPYEDAISDEGRVTRKYKRIPSDAIREDYMVRYAMTKAGEAKSILILCGFNHGRELRDRF
jgi:hypothetical protein